MRLNSTYHFYRSYFGYPRAKGKTPLTFALAIRDFTEVLLKSYNMKSFDPFHEYKERSKKHSLTLNFLENIQSIVESRFSNPFRSLEYVENEVIIPWSILSTRRRGIVVPIPYLYFSDDSEIIFIVFGSTENMKQELNVFAGLVKYFKTLKPIPSSLRHYSYWNVRDGESASIKARTITAVSYDSLLSTCNKL